MSNSEIHHFSSSRRQFLQAMAGMAALSAEALAMQRPGPAGIPVRPLGKSGASVTIIGLGGWDVVANKSDGDAIRLMHEALDSGITFFDKAWEYHDGRSEEVMGRALQEGGRRENVFLMSKVCARDYEGAKRHIEDSLRRLRTDRLDLLQFHSLQYPGDQERIMDPDQGALKAALEAKKAGKFRYLGFTGHQNPQVHLKMLASDYPFDSVQMPLNILDAHYMSFEKSVLPECRRREIGVLGMKSLAAQNGRIARDLNVGWELCRRYAMSLPIASLVCGIQTREQLLGMVRVAKDFKPMGAEEAEALLVQSRNPSRDGHIEQYKNPQSGYGCSYHTGVLEA
ncbi:MAG: aldo/keto reductase [Bryobacterales bacterium]|nr:aldo/keto reductase [Bryobacterales bacterium]